MKFWSGTDVQTRTPIRLNFAVNTALKHTGDIPKTVSRSVSAQRRILRSIRSDRNATDGRNVLIPRTGPG